LFAQPTDALPLDLFRFLLGVPVFAYFLCTFFEARDFSGPDGRIDHDLSLQIFWTAHTSLLRSFCRHRVSGAAAIKQLRIAPVYDSRQLGVWSQIMS
jgi:hypothetical protein